MNGHYDISNQTNFITSQNKHNISKRQGAYSKFFRLATKDPESTAMKFRMLDNKNVTPRSTNDIDLAIASSVLLRRCEPDQDEFGHHISLKKENEGFQVPKAPLNHKKNWEEETRAVKKILSELMDNVEATEAFHFMKRTEALLQNLMKKRDKNLDRYGPLDRNRKLQIVHWINSTAVNGEVPLPPPVSTSAISSILPLNMKQCTESAINTHQKSSKTTNHQDHKDSSKNVYRLMDWTIVKGRAPIEVMVSGDLIDISKKTLIEEGHTSSKILSADKGMVQTCCCIYHLAGDFVNPFDNIPSTVTKFFEDGKFPKNWKDVIRMWSVLEDKEVSQEYSIRHLNKSTHYDLGQESGDGLSRKKTEMKRYEKDVYNTFEKWQRDQKRHQQPQNSRADLRNNRTILSDNEKDHPKHRSSDFSVFSISSDEE